MHGTPDLRKDLEFFLPAILSERYFSAQARSRALIVSGGVSALAFLFFFIATFLPGIPFSADIPLGVFFMVVAIFLKLLFLKFYLNAIYFRGVTQINREAGGDDEGLTYESAEILSIQPNDLTLAFLFSRYGRLIMLRSGITDSAVDAFLRSASRAPLNGLAIHDNAPGPMSFEHVASYLYANDPAFKEFLMRAGVREDLFFGAVSWLARVYAAEKHRARWWGKDNLGKIRGIGSEFSFGIAYSLQRFVRSLESTTVFSDMAGADGYGKETLAKVEKILARAKEANVLLVAEPGVGELDILAALSRRLSQGESVASIEGKHVVLFDGESFVATYASKQAFEQEFIRLANGAARAGNLIIVIANIGTFIHNAEALSVDFDELIDPYLVSSAVQFVGTTDPDTFHRHIETRPRLMQRFESVLVEAPPLSGTVRVLEDVAPVHERRYGIYFTYASLQTIAESADRYITEGVMPDKAVDLLVEISAAAGPSGVALVTESYVQEVVAKKTGIPMGPVTEKERDLLMNLEATLHSYVIGQEPAVDAIADAMRRARAGVQASNRPMGSFMFLGPTGVGKTETAKALARVFFGDESKMLRLDMSEYNSGSGFSRLLGSAQESGKLADMLHEHPYGVLLLDEFEKGAREVHDLFLQILDEGVYTDGRGKHVNARNTIIIATSNAGSDMLWDLVARGEHPREHKAEIISHIVEAGIYRPELLNRFDGVIVFEPLDQEQMQKIARIMLKGLTERIRTKGYTLVVNDALVNLLVRKGYDPLFGVRPMRRAMQDIIEGKIAEKIIAGGLRPGDTIEFKEEELAAIV